MFRFFLLLSLLEYSMSFDLVSCVIQPLGGQSHVAVRVYRSAGQKQLAHSNWVI